MVDRLYLQGDKSRVSSSTITASLKPVTVYHVQVVDIDHPDSGQFPLFASAERYETDLEPGDVLFIPALWFHNMLGIISAGQS